MSSRLLAKTCVGIAPRAPHRPSERADPNRHPLPASTVDDDTPDKYGVIIFDGGPWQARRVVLAFDTPLEAAAYAAEHQLSDYLVAPLSFLSPTGVPRA